MPSIPCTSAAKYTAGLGSARVAKTHEGRNSTRVLRGLKHKRRLPGAGGESDYVGRMRATLLPCRLLCLGFLGIGFQSSTTVSTALRIHRCAVSRLMPCIFMNALMATSIRALAVLRMASSGLGCSLFGLIRCLWLVELGDGTGLRSIASRIEQQQYSWTCGRTRKAVDESGLSEKSEDGGLRRSAFLFDDGFVRHSLVPILRRGGLSCGDVLRNELE